MTGNGKDCDQMLSMECSNVLRAQMESEGVKKRILGHNHAKTSCMDAWHFVVLQGAEELLVVSEINVLCSVQGTCSCSRSPHFDDEIQTSESLLTQFSSHPGEGGSVKQIGHWLNG